MQDLQRAPDVFDLLTSVSEHTLGMNLTDSNQKKRTMTRKEWLAWRDTMRTEVTCIESHRSSIVP